jgi:hypothetical protein
MDAKLPHPQAGFPIPIRAIGVPHDSPARGRAIGIFPALWLPKRAGRDPFTLPEALYA